MKTTNDQNFLTKCKPFLVSSQTGFDHAESSGGRQSKLIVTRAILNARVYQSRIQACTPTLMSSPFINGGDYV